MRGATVAEFKAKSAAEMRKLDAELVERVRRRLIEGSCEGMGGFDEIVARAVARTDWLAEATDVVAIVQSEAANLIEAQARRIEEVEAALKRARLIIQCIDDYQRRPERGDYGVECACCMGELLDDDRSALAEIDALLSTPGAS